MGHDLVTGKVRSVSLLTLAEIAAMSLWFVSAAILPDMIAESGIPENRGAALSSAVQLGFVAGALAIAVSGVSDRFDPRIVFFISALIASGANAALLFTETGSNTQILLRGITGAALAGCYPVGMKIIVGWGLKDRGFLVGLFVAALTLGSASPHLLALLGGSDWRTTVVAASVISASGSLLLAGVALGPHHAKSASFNPQAILIAWTNRRARLAIAGYLGHMWELFAFWAWIGLIALTSYRASLGEGAETAARLTAFLAIALGGLACIPAGLVADRIGKARIARLAMIGSLIAGLATAASFNGPFWLVAPCLLLWGILIIPDSAQFSALLADAVPPELSGSLMTIQTALGFLLTTFTVQIVPATANQIGWPATLVLMALGPAFGIEAMRRLIVLTR